MLTVHCSLSLSLFLSLSLSLQGARRFWKMADADGDKLITPSEFYTMLVRVIGHQAAAKAEAKHQTDLMKAVAFEALQSAPGAPVSIAMIVACFGASPGHLGEVVEMSHHEDAVADETEFVQLHADDLTVVEEAEHTYSHHADAVVGDAEWIATHPSEVEIIGDSKAEALVS